MAEITKSVFVGKYASIYRARFEGNPPYESIKVTEYPISWLKALFGRLFGKNVIDVPVVNFDKNTRVIDFPELDAINGKATGRNIRFVLCDLMCNPDFRLRNILAPSDDIQRLQNVEMERDYYMAALLDLSERLPQLDSDELRKELLKILDVAKEARKRQFTVGDLLRRSE